MATKPARRAASSAPRPKPSRPAPAKAEAEERRGSISWLHCLIGLLVGEVVLFVISNAGLAIANAVFGGTGQADGGIVGVSTLVAILGGGFLAARLAGHHGLWQGIVVAIGFIAIGAVFQFLQEASVVHTALAGGTHQLVDLGPMNMGNLVGGDFLALFSGSVGGLLARRN